MAFPSRERVRPSWPVRLVDAVARMVIFSVGMAAAGIALSVCYGIVMRSIVGQPVIWVEEISAYLIGYMTFVGIGAALHQGAHVGIDFLIERLPPRGRRAVLRAGDVLLLALAAVLVRLSWQFWSDAWITGERSPSLLSVPLWIPYLCFFIGSILLLVMQVARLAAGPEAARSAEASHAARGDPP